jgi:two-component system sensor histidine kinase GlrK
MTGVVVAGSLLAAAPLLIGMTMAGFALDRLAKNTEQLLAQGITREYYGAQLRDNLENLRRNAQQYAALGDPALLNVFFSRWWASEATIQSIEALGLHAPVADNITRLRQGLTRAAQSWTQVSEDSAALDAAVENVEQLVQEADAIIIAGRAAAAAELDRMRTEAGAARRMLLLLGLTLLPLTALLALGASIAVTRPFKDMSRGIVALGNSRYDQPIQIGFPAEMQRLGEYLDWLRRKLAQLETDKDQFLRHVSHELKTPLATIKEGTALLREGSLGLLTPRQNEVALILAESVGELGARIANLLSYAEWREDRRAANMDWFEALPLVEETLLSQKLPMLRRTLSTELDIQTPRLFGQRAQLRVALDNLVANAVRHSPRGAAISIHAGIHDSRCQVWVRDRGSGVPQHDREKIFEPFVRGSQPDYSTPGTLPGSGIGLSVVRETVLAHGGTVEVADAQPGAIFKMEWPCAQVTVMRAEGHAA